MLARSGSDTAVYVEAVVTQRCMCICMRVVWCGVAWCGVVWCGVGVIRDTINQDYVTIYTDSVVPLKMPNSR